jgi:DNA-binding MarR family transcriptional regulator
MSTKSGFMRCPVTADLTGAAQCVAFNFRKTARALTKAYDVVLQPSGLRSAQFVALVWIAKLQPVSIGDLANVLGVDPSTLSRGLRLMQKQRLLTVSGRSAMRQRFVTLSAQGTRKLDDAVLLWQHLQEHLLAFIGRKNWDRMRQDMEKLSHHAGSPR